MAISHSHRHLSALSHLCRPSAAVVLGYGSLHRLYAASVIECSLKLRHRRQLWLQMRQQQRVQSHDAAWVEAAVLHDP